MADKEPVPKVSQKKPKAAEEKGTTKKVKFKYKKGLPPLNIFLHWCKGCNICIALCPQKVLEPDRDGKPILVRPEDCTQCAICWLHCPDFAITSNYK